MTREDMMSYNNMLTRPLDARLNALSAKAKSDPIDITFCFLEGSRSFVVTKLLIHNK